MYLTYEWNISQKVISNICVPVNNGHNQYKSQCGCPLSQLSITIAFTALHWQFSSPMHAGASFYFLAIFYGRHRAECPLATGLHLNHCLTKSKTPQCRSGSYEGSQTARRPHTGLQGLIPYSLFQTEGLIPDHIVSWSLRSGKYTAERWGELCICLLVLFLYQIWNGVGKCLFLINEHCIDEKLALPSLCNSYSFLFSIKYCMSHLVLQT